MKVEIFSDSKVEGWGCSLSTCLAYKKSWGWSLAAYKQGVVAPTCNLNTGRWRQEGLKVLGRPGLQETLSEKKKKSSLYANVCQKGMKHLRDFTLLTRLQVGCWNKPKDFPVRDKECIIEVAEKVMFASDLWNPSLHMTVEEMHITRKEATLFHSNNSN